MNNYTGTLNVEDAARAIELTRDLPAAHWRLNGRMVPTEKQREGLLEKMREYAAGTILRSAPDAVYFTEDVEDSILHKGTATKLSVLYERDLNGLTPEAIREALASPASFTMAVLSVGPAPSSVAQFPRVFDVMREDPYGPESPYMLDIEPIEEQLVKQPEHGLEMPQIGIAVELQEQVIGILKRNGLIN